MKIIPAIDIIDGKCVRLSQGDFNTKKVYNENPVEVAKQFANSGIQYLHLVDLDGARSKHIVNHAVLEKISHSTPLKIDFGGGLKSDDDLRIAFECGANQITCGSIAVHKQEVFNRWLLQYGSEKIILGADCKNGKIATHGWLENSELEVLDFIDDYAGRGVKYVVCTDIEKDGMLRGPAIELYKKIIGQSEVRLIASGGVSSVDELKELQSLGCAGAIIGKAIYEGKISLKELEKLC